MAYGEHIIGTYAVDEHYVMYPITTYAGSVDDKMHGYPAAFKPICRPLPMADDGKDIFYFFCISYHEKNYGNNLHVYAKCMIYAYKHLIEHTNILDIGKVRFFVDKRCLGIVKHYARITNIESLIVPIDSKYPMNYAAYIPCFFHPVAENFKYRVYTDLDMWWANMSEKDNFDFGTLIDEWDRLPENFYGQRVPKTHEQSHIDLYERYLENDKQRHELKTIMKQMFDAETLENDLGISGTRMALRNSDSTEKLAQFYEQYGHLLRDDEALWSVFFTHTNELVADIGRYMPGGGPTKEEQNAWKNSPMLVNVGSYHFDHYHRERYDGFEKLYNHWKEKQ